MSDFIEFFNFSFLKKIDRYILLNYPSIWSFKLPYIVFYGFIVNIVFLLILLFNEEKNYDMPDFINSFLGVWYIGMFFLIRWISRQNYAEKEFGKYILSGVKEYMLLLFTFIIFGLSLFIMEDVILLKKHPQIVTETILVLFISLLLLLYRIVGMKNLFFALYGLVILVFPMRMSLEKSLVEIVLVFTLFVFVQSLYVLLVYFFSKNKLLFSLTSILLIVGDLIFILEVSIKFFNETNVTFIGFIAITFLMIVVGISYIKKELLKIVSEPKKI